MLQGVIMKKDNENVITKQKLMQCARQEFLEKGFLRASLRNICKMADVTTGALYFFFKDKDDLFCSLFRDVIVSVQMALNEHYEAEQIAAENESIHLDNEFVDEFMLTNKLIDIMYPRRNDILLALTKAEGSSAEFLVDSIIKRMDEHNRSMVDSMSRKLGHERLSDDVVHWLSHSQVDMFVFMIVHIDNKEDARVYATDAMKYLIGGWLAIFGIRSNEDIF